jgi:hypothetical protein
MLERDPGFFVLRAARLRHHTQENIMKQQSKPSGVAPVLRRLEGRIAGARIVRLMRNSESAFSYGGSQWSGLPQRVANAYGKFEDKARLVQLHKSFG